MYEAEDFDRRAKKAKNLLLHISTKPNSYKAQQISLKEQKVGKKKLLVHL